ncbi:MAG: TVP38/TMEM64 family protein [Desulfobacteraceae bacterium]|nr:TVP38/TMEM64 family protein [Desulfobacteraceae bacterium]
MSWKKIALFALVAALIGGFFLSGLGQLFTLETLKANHRQLAAAYAQHRLAVTAVFLAIYIAQAALSLPGAAVLSLAAGALFGLARGMVVVNIGATTGATLAFLFARYLFREPVARKLGGPRLEKLNRELEREGMSYLLFLRLVPVFPFFLINLGAALTAIPLRTFFIGTLVGIVPGSLVFVNAGASLATIQTVSDVTSPRVLGSFTLLGLFALVPAIYDKIKKGNGGMSPG